jgi:hypothetical protein
MQPGVFYEVHGSFRRTSYDATPLDMGSILTSEVLAHKDRSDI